VVGPSGVFTVNTKNVKGSVWLAPRTLLLNGQWTDWLPKAAREARRASRSLSAALGRSVTVTGVLAVLADDWTIKEMPTDVHVGTPRGVKKWLLSLPAALSTSEVGKICAAAAKPSTWAGSQRGGSRPI
jgi:hypothetical protein